MVRINKIPKHLVPVLKETAYEQVMLYEHGVYYRTGTNYIYFSNLPRLNALSVSIEPMDLIFLQQADKQASFSFVIDEETELVDLAWQDVKESSDRKKEILALIEAKNPMTGLQIKAKALLENYEYLTDFLKRRPMADLLGRGLGLTPSGDDILAGILASSFYLKRNFLVPEDLDLSRTNHISGQFLSYALAGIFSEDLLALFAGGKVEEIIERMLKTGYTSGADTLLGVYYALNQ